MNIAPDKNCPCGSQKPYQDCCQALHLGLDSGAQLATSPEQLMRSRYCAFTLKNFDYIIKAHHADYLDGLTLEQLQQGPHPHWLGLDVLSADETIHADGRKHGTVTFKAWYKMSGEIDAIYERSEFIFEQDRWFYTKGHQMHAKLPGRNDPCVCHSGKKFKQCCLKG